MDDMRGTCSSKGQSALYSRRAADAPIEATARRANEREGAYDRVPAQVYPRGHRDGSMTLSVVSSGRSVHLDIPYLELVALRDRIVSHLEDF
jgi:hypothetical protein